MREVGEGAAGREDDACLRKPLEGGRGDASPPRRPSGASEAEKRAPWIDNIFVDNSYAPPHAGSGILARGEGKRKGPPSTDGTPSQGAARAVVRPLPAVSGSPSQGGVHSEEVSNKRSISHLPRGLARHP